MSAHPARALPRPPVASRADLRVVRGARDDTLRRAGDLVGALLEHRRVAAGTQSCPGTDCCIEARLPAVMPLVASGRPIRMVLPAFPAKSPSRRKVLGVVPDLAEEMALKYLQRLCDRLGEIHRPGVRVTICSDGRVFGDVVGVTDEDVSEYGVALRRLIARHDLVSLDVFNLEDVYGSIPFEAMRRRVCAEHADAIEAVRARVRSDDDERRLFNGVHRFLIEDLRGVHPERSRNALSMLAKQRAYHVIQRSRAWSGLVERRFPDALRLSIHPQRPHDDTKLGIRLADETADAWVTPWHGVGLYVGPRYTLTYRHLAEDAGARLVLQDGRPSHYVLP